MYLIPLAFESYNDILHMVETIFFSKPPNELTSFDTL